MAGRPPKPTKLKELAGNPGKRRLNESEPKPPTEDQVPKPPTHIKGKARKEWTRIAALLHEMDLLSSVDLTALAMYCQLYERWLEAEDHIRRDGMVAITEKGYPVQSPYVGIASNAMKQMKGLLTEFGMTPSSRSRVQGGREQKRLTLDELLDAAVNGGTD